MSIDPIAQRKFAEGLGFAAGVFATLCGLALLSIALGHLEGRRRIDTIRQHQAGVHRHCEHPEDQR